jgi:hypothetical protein
LWACKRQRLKELAALLEYIRPTAIEIAAALAREAYTPIRKQAAEAV